MLYFGIAYGLTRYCLYLSSSVAVQGIYHGNCLVTSSPLVVFEAAGATLFTFFLQGFIILLFRYIQPTALFEVKSTRPRPRSTRSRHMWTPLCHLSSRF